MKREKCSYPGCSAEASYLPKEGLPLCEEHYRLWRFIKEVLEEAEVTISLRKRKEGF